MLEHVCVSMDTHVMAHLWMSEHNMPESHKKHYICKSEIILYHCSDISLTFIKGEENIVCPVM